MYQQPQLEVQRHFKHSLSFLNFDSAATTPTGAALQHRVPATTTGSAEALETLTTNLTFDSAASTLTEAALLVSCTSKHKWNSIAIWTADGAASLNVWLEA